MKYSYLFLIIGFCGIFSCTSKNGKNDLKEVAADTVSYYPIGDFIKEQIQYVDLRNFPIYKITQIDDKKDSSSISTEEFKTWANRFLVNDISKPEMKGKFKETVFNDMSTESVTLHYTPKDQHTDIQSVDVLLNQNTQLVKRIFMTRISTKGDTTFTEQFSWKADKSLQLNRSISTSNGFHRKELNLINWNDKNTNQIK